VLDRLRLDVLLGGWRPRREASEEEFLELVRAGRSTHMETSLALDHLVQIASQHVVVTATDVPEVVPFEECPRRKERGTAIAVSECLSLRDPVSK
jgi:hypothetical protein